jgi:glycosyltransferase involved in cell wall biosynthesis
MRVLIATDAWRPQVNGVVRSLEHVAREAPCFGIEIVLLTPDRFRTVPLPGYSEIRLSLATAGAVRRHFGRHAPTHIHIATEGPLGLATRRACLQQGRPFTPSYHTRFPEYLALRRLAPKDWTYAALRRFHGASCGVMVSTPSLEAELSSRGFRRLMRWSRGVDTELFRPRTSPALDLPRPVFLFVGRIAVEKNLEAFLSLDLPGSKVIVGDGPQRAALAAAYPDARFLGTLAGEDLARVYAAADVFVFPSLTDTFGIVLLEALASGVPVAAFPVSGPADVIGSSGCGALDADLKLAALRALEIPRERCRTYALGFSWRESARQFFQNISVAHERR